MPGSRLTSQERAQIEVLFGHGLMAPQIAVSIGRDRATVWREQARIPWACRSAWRPAVWPRSPR